MDSTTPEWTPQATEGKSKSLKWLMIIAFVVVILAGAVIYYFYIYKPAGTSVSSTQQNSTGDWSAYSNSYYGYSLQYPKKWQVNENDVADVKFTRHITNDATLNIEPPVMFEVKSVSDQKNQTVDVWVAAEFTNKAVKTASYVLAGKPGVMVTITKEGQSDSNEIFLISDEVKYRLIQGEASKDDFIKIAESFKLIKRQTNTSTNDSSNKTQSALTQTYTNEKSGISVKYPEGWEAKNGTSIDSKVLLWESFGTKNFSGTGLFELKVSSRSLTEETALYKNKLSGSEISSESPTKLGDYTGTKIVSSKNQIETTAYLVKRDQYTYIIDGQSKNPSSNVTLYFSQMIDSINFIKIQ